MKRQIIIVALSVVLFASLSQAQTPAAPAAKAPEPTMEQKYAEAEIGRINAEFQLFQLDMQAVARKYPDYIKEVQLAVEAAIKRLQPELQELQKKLAPVKK